MQIHREFPMASIKMTTVSNLDDLPLYRTVIQGAYSHKFPARPERSKPTTIRPSHPDEPEKSQKEHDGI
jgi:hypothetical protein